MANLRNYRKFLQAGYSWRELGLNFFRYMVWSRISSALHHSFARRGRGVVIDYTVCVQGGRFIEIDDGTWVQRHAWLTVPLIELATPPLKPVLRIGRRVQIGPRCVLSAAREVLVEDDVLLGQNVYVADHIHAFRDITKPVKDQGISTSGSVRIGKGSWIGNNVVVVANEADLSIGEGAVVAANSVVTRSIPPHSVAAGSPARVADRYDPVMRRWLRRESQTAVES